MRNLHDNCQDLWLVVDPGAVSSLLPHQDQLSRLLIADNLHDHLVWKLTSDRNFPEFFKTLWLGWAHKIKLSMLSMTYTIGGPYVVGKQIFKTVPHREHKGCAPTYSRRDQFTLRAWLEMFTVPALFTDTNIRQRIRKNLSAIDCLEQILLVWFWQNVHYTALLR